MEQQTVPQDPVVKQEIQKLNDGYGTIQATKKYKRQEPKQQVYKKRESEQEVIHNLIKPQQDKSVDDVVLQYTKTEDSQATTKPIASLLNKIKPVTIPDTER